MVTGKSKIIGAKPSRGSLETRSLGGGGSKNGGGGGSKGGGGVAQPEDKFSTTVKRNPDGSKTITSTNIRTGQQTITSKDSSGQVTNVQTISKFQEQKQSGSSFPEVTAERERLIKKAATQKAKEAALKASSASEALRLARIAESQELSLRLRAGKPSPTIKKIATPGRGEVLVREETGTSFPEVIAERERLIKQEKIERGQAFIKKTSGLTAGQLFEGATPEGFILRTQPRVKEKKQFFGLTQTLTKKSKNLLDIGRGKAPIPEPRSELEEKLLSTKAGRAFTRFGAGVGGAIGGLTAVGTSVFEPATFSLFNLDKQELSFSETGELTPSSQKFISEQREGQIQLGFIGALIPEARLLGARRAATKRRAKEPSLIEEQTPGEPFNKPRISNKGLLEGGFAPLEELSITRRPKLVQSKLPRSKADPKTAEIFRATQLIEGQAEKTLLGEEIITRVDPGSLRLRGATPEQKLIISRLEGLTPGEKVLISSETKQLPLGLFEERPLSALEQRASLLRRKNLQPPTKQTDLLLLFNKKGEVSFTGLLEPSSIGGELKGTVQRTSGLKTPFPTLEPSNLLTRSFTGESLLISGALKTSVKPSLENGSLLDLGSLEVQRTGLDLLERTITTSKTQTITKTQSDSLTRLLITPTSDTTSLLDLERTTSPKERSLLSLDLNLDLGITPKKRTRTPPPLNPFDKRERRKKGKKERTGYNIFIRERAGGGFFQANEKPLPRNKALNKGADIVDNSVAKTFFIKPSLETTTLKDSKTFVKKNKFRRPKRNSLIDQNLLIEKDSAAIDSQGERNGITAKGLIAIRQKKKKKTFSASKDVFNFSNNLVNKGLSLRKVRKLLR